MKSLLLLATVCVAITGCATAASDRGNWTEVNVALDLDYNFDGVDRTSEPTANSADDAAVTDVGDGELAEAIQTAAAAGMPFIYAPVEVTISGAGAAESAGETTQSPTNEPEGNLEVPIVP